jgi:hypothetical protein
MPVHTLATEINAQLIEGSSELRLIYKACGRREGAPVYDGITNEPMDIINGATVGIRIATMESGAAIARNVRESASEWPRDSQPRNGRRGIGADPHPGGSIGQAPVDSRREEVDRGLGSSGSGNSSRHLSINLSLPPPTNPKPLRPVILRRPDATDSRALGLDPFLALLTWRCCCSSSCRGRGCCCCLCSRWCSRWCSRCCWPILPWSGDTDEAGSPAAGWGTERILRARAEDGECGRRDASSSSRARRPAAPSRGSGGRRGRRLGAPAPQLPPQPSSTLGLRRVLPVPRIFASLAEVLRIASRMQFRLTSFLPPTIVLLKSRSRHHENHKSQPKARELPALFPINHTLLYPCTLGKYAFALRANHPILPQE